MAKSNMREEKNKFSRSAVLFSKLDLSKDERLTRTPIETGRISHYFRTFKKNYTELMLANLMFMVFALPAILIVFWLTPSLIKALNATLDFNGDMGIGFGGKYDIIQGMDNIYTSYQNMFWMLIPCFSVMGLGFAGLFYCCRNLLWGAPVKIRKHFFRGIKKRWADFLLAFTYLGGVVWMVGFSILSYMRSSLVGEVNGGHWAFMIFSALLFLLSIIYLSISLPMTVSFRYKFGSVIKNTLILSVTMFLLPIFLFIVLALPLLGLMNSFLRIMLYVAIAMVGFSTYVLAVSALAQNMFDSTIIPLYEHEQKMREKEEKKERDRQKRIENRAKNNNKKKRK